MEEKKVNQISDEEMVQISDCGKKMKKSLRCSESTVLKKKQTNSREKAFRSDRN